MIHSPTCQHALRALIYLAGVQKESPVLVRDIAQGSAAPRQSLAKILHSLRRSGLVRSTKGPGGGYSLARPPGEITLLEVIEAIDGKLDLEDTCILGLDECADDAPCALHTYWGSFREEYTRRVSTMTLENAAETLAHKREGS